MSLLLALLQTQNILPMYCIFCFDVMLSDKSDRANVTTPPSTDLGYMPIPFQSYLFCLPMNAHI